jgi:hypothetical protein
MRTLLPGLKQQVTRRVIAERLSQLGIHLFCVPFPSTQDFTRRLRRELGLPEGVSNGAS